MNNGGLSSTLHGHLNGSGMKIYTAEPTNGATYDFGIQTQLLASDQGPSFTHSRALADFDRRATRDVMHLFAERQVVVFV